MQIVRTQDVTSKQADAAYFTGRVWQEPVVETPEPARVRALRVTFEPGARTAWHTHPLGQTLHVLSGVGLIGTRDGTVEEIHAGDTVWIPPGEEHWHGATPDRMMCHMAIQEAQDGRVADWLEQVSDADYARS
ncbi:MAG: cupin domain-containing protein [Roseovarius sp.]|uniref:(R)-mandelonitrile lyase n=1 Tax=Roseovarius sp. TaxID=1486281 RepID=UPI0032ED2B62